jgi:hypothetical protein
VHVLMHNLLYFLKKKSSLSVQDVLLLKIDNQS